MLVSIRTARPLADDLLASAPQLAETQNLHRILNRYRASIKPTFPGNDDPRFKTQFSAEVSSLDDASRLCEGLLKADGIEAAYVKPEAEPAH